VSRLNPRQATEIVTVSTPGDSGSWGTTPGPDVDVRAVYLAKRELVRDKDGVEVVSEVTLLVAPEHNPGVDDLEALFSPGTDVDVRSGEHQVIGAEAALNRGRVVYVRVTLT
jgi:hypothetical protein